MIEPEKRAAVLRSIERAELRGVGRFEAEGMVEEADKARVRAQQARYLLAELVRERGLPS